MSFVAVAVGAVVVGAVGSVASAKISADAAKSAANTQYAWLNRMQAYTQEQMDPALINKQALEADTERAKNQLALQKEIDPALAQQRTVSETKLSDQLAQIGNAPSDKVAAEAAAEGLAQTPGAEKGKAQLIQSALDQLNAGATLPPDVQAELMQSGLQQASGVTGGAPNTGTGGAASSILSRVIGTAGVNLQMQRQQQASQLLTAASNLDAQRQQILQGLFPKLQQQQLSNMSAASGILQQSNSMLPQAGLTGTQVASDWLARVGAINALSGQKAAVQANSILAQGQANANMVGSASSAIGGLGTMGVSSFFNQPASTPAATPAAINTNNQPINTTNWAVPSY